ncbi:hypothetical protein ACVQLA_06895 [Acinetobacter baumannii]|uniref:Uncharacterized protein n=12 Tax=Acinetobacter baumannii TaxID=470 RepID=A0A0D5YFG5_ACIBA|nr:hypothetical protein [Acinetobacter baumannii]PXA50606.1 hypothetical protein DMB35_15280 [Acinetobacter baumannii A424]ACJ42070.1 hypothetical protein AB57_2719 [Acinetobacter baumannii AB0057]AJF82442.1 hypothetical protein ABA1_02553 [Acinetobacter baumannii]AKA31022.1 hypothetical protein ABUW_1274 [Acinetobacter baumannii]ARG32475.1 hypothetical protein B7L41_14920 [Acinetobacter baumannii]
MKPEQFIREFGPNTFRISMSFVNTAKYLVVHEGEIDFTDEIKPHHGERVFERDVVNRLIESLDLVKKLGGLQGAKAYVPDGYKSDRLKQAIKDHESIYGGGDE